MFRTLAGRYLLFGVLGIEALVLPYFLSKEVYGEIEFLKFTAFLFQFALFGAGTGYVVRYMKEPVEVRQHMTNVFAAGAFFQSAMVSLAVALFYSPVYGALVFPAMLAMAVESIYKVRETYLLAMSFKPILSTLIISFIPLILFLEWPFEWIVICAFGLALLLFVISFCRSQKFIGREFITQLSNIPRLLGEYRKNIAAGFLINITTALTFLFFYVDRAVVREKFPEALGDYSLSYAIMQLTIVAITAFAYVNVVEFGKEHADLEGLRKKVFRAFKHCLFFYLIIGCCSIAFSYGAEVFYGYERVFETTLLMVGLFGLANVAVSVNSAHLYLGSIRLLAFSMALVFLISLAINMVIPFETEQAYYFLLAKTYGLYFLLSVLSFSYICYRLRKV